MPIKINCIIVDDEPLAQKGMEGFVADITFLNLIKVCDNATQALDVISTQKVDLMFLDIKMPNMTGLDLLKNLTRPPVTIITTAYPDYAVAGFELNVLDYIIKPIPFDRFVKAVSKAKEYLELLSKSGTARSNDFCFIRCESKYEKIFFNEIIFVEALQNYVIIHTKTKRLTSYLTIKSIEEQLPAEAFIKISKSFVVSIPKIENIEGNIIHIGVQSFSIGRPFREQVLERLLKGHLVKRI